MTWKMMMPMIRSVRMTNWMRTISCLLSLAKEIKNLLYASTRSSWLHPVGLGEMILSFS
ncbi:hypothetical protein [Segatella albensis]|uniref:hypothetical protein n=1 Tax=Segatella albensis TaxID=77768 RepID=UPI0012DF7D61|nr:hypothetical protein [Segatella albensis]